MIQYYYSFFILNWLECESVFVMSEDGRRQNFIGHHNIDK